MTIGVTDHDRDLVIAGQTYRAAPGMTPSAIERGDGLDAVTMEARGALTADGLTARDLLAGRWDGARVTVSAVDWDAQDALTWISSGTIGAVEIGEAGFGAELLGMAEALDRPVSEATSAGCRASLGDARCRVPMAGRRRYARVVSVEGRTVTVDRDEPSPDAYGGGSLRWLGGAGCGLEDGIAQSSGRTLALRLPPHVAAAAGTPIELREGCDKTIATCAARFANAANFRGEPYLPGIDLLTRYPGA
ncbi:DUF2163 domain-containing protein [Sphingomonas sp. NBWT7]|uniref:DUF2163 domain-containing protein n=1 Tax=Sphingomonas sp. NBWT7 TaxID=2596913 RepID=UPI00215644E0|nr:DUF2163 domain-containing protein [Sphingomonas sp. NBWT7]